MPTAFETFVCEECKGVDFSVESAQAPLRYIGVGKEIVHRLKYGATARGSGAEGSRGFNQAELLAQGVASGLKAPVSDTIQVVHKTRDQVELSAAERRANASGAFSARGRIRGKVLLIDDVFTTGATMSACAETLLRARAGEVHALSLCRTS